MDEVGNLNANNYRKNVPPQTINECKRDEGGI